MKKYIYIIIILIIANNIFLLNRHFTLKKELDILSKSSLFEKDYQEQRYISYLHKISDSVYLKDIVDINIVSNNLTIKIALKKDMKIGDIVSDMEKCFERLSKKVNIYNDEYILIEFGE